MPTASSLKILEAFGRDGLEPPTSCSRSARATKLRYHPRCPYCTYPALSQGARLEVGVGASGTLPRQDVVPFSPSLLYFALIPNGSRFVEAAIWLRRGEYLVRAIY